MKKTIFIALLFSVLFLLPSTQIFAEELSFVSYYPSPFGAYDRFLLKPRAALGTPCQLGMIYFDEGDSQLKICQRRGTDTTWTTMNIWAQDRNLVLNKDYIYTMAQGPNVFLGVGTITPTKKLHVADGDALLEGDLSVNSDVDIGGNMVVGGSTTECPTCKARIQGDAKVNKLFLKANGTNVGELDVFYSLGKYYATPYYAP